ncbi:hypothetical protein PIB30_045749 [Stylosanthes scabra]|uniref:BAH domain-containing protein n=1 Tax=Stylosanthes scabra TaxID=79078 RepID=A0ABU6RGT0_9FABA|nr:hypothetical protein [Stylosanthes scabra]
MAVTDRCFVEWKEQFVSQERGNRVVHYYLKDSDGESILAVVGTERSVRHMFYVVADEFLEICGKEGSVPAGFKWRSRREVVDWLTSTLSKKHLQGDRSGSPSHSSGQAYETTNGSVNEITGLPAPIANGKGFLTRNSKLSKSDIVWSGVAWTCGKQLKHYHAFCRNGIKIIVQSFVYVMGKGENHYVAYLEDMYEDRRGQKKVKVRWFHHNQEVKGVIPVRNPHPREVFITPYSQVISAECVDGPTTVLSREHYEKCMPCFSPTSLDRIHMCFRQFRSNKVKPFDLSKLRGYYDQPLLSCLQFDSMQKSPKGNSLAGGDEELSAGENLKLRAKRRDRGTPQSLMGRKGVRKLVRSQQMMVYKNSQGVNNSRTDRRLFSRKEVESQPWYNVMYKIDDKIEVLCQDSGIRGCWFRCTVVQVSRKQMKVQYDDIQDEDGSGNLEEWIPAFKLAMPDKLGIRHPGRSTIRPAPPPSNDQELVIGVGTAVDAWWSDGWWEGVVTGTDNYVDDNVQLYFPGEGLLMKVHKKDLRISRDWSGDRWIDIKPKFDLTSTIFPVNGVNTKPCTSPSPSIAKDGDSIGAANSCDEALVSDEPINNEPDVSEEKVVCHEGVAEDGDKNDDEDDNSNLPSEKDTEVDNNEIEMNNIDNEDNGDDSNKDSENGNKDTEVFGTSVEEDCKTGEPAAEMAV